MTNLDLSVMYPRLEDIPEQFQIKEPYHINQILIDGELKQWEGPRTDIYSTLCVKGANGLDQVLLGSIPNSGVEDADMAIAAAVDAYSDGRGAWPNMRVSERIQCIQKFTNLMISKKADVVKMLMWEIGKTYADSEKEFDRTVEYIKNTVDELKKIDNLSSRFEIVDGTIAQIRRSPLGIVLCMGPYNYPLNETFTTLIPALIMGNVVLFKPPRMGVLLFKPLLDAFKEAFPAGVVNILFGKGSIIAPHIMSTGKVNVLAFIGSSKVANQLKKAHPKTNRLRAVLGLDAKNAGIIMPDADLNTTVKEVITGALSFNGQRCTALKILFVHQSIAKEFNALLTEEVNKLKLGMPWDKGVSITPLPERGKIAYMSECIQDALEYGADVINQDGGSTFETLMKPAVVYPVNSNMKLYKEEQFGPIVPVVPYTDIEEVLDYITESDFGQQVSLFGTDANKIAVLVDNLVNQVCRVNINCQCQRGPDIYPFVGRKDSAEGTLSVHDALRAFSIRTMVATKQTELSKQILDEIVMKNLSAFINTRFIL